MSSNVTEEGRAEGVNSRSDQANVDFGSVSDVSRALRLQRELRRLAPGLNRYDSLKTDESIQWNTDRLLQGAASHRATTFGEAHSSFSDESDEEGSTEGAGPPLPSRLIVEHQSLTDLIRDDAVGISTREA